jgi:hypothetical protein
MFQARGIFGLAAMSSAEWDRVIVLGRPARTRGHDACGGALQTG